MLLLFCVKLILAPALLVYVVLNKINGNYEAYTTIIWLIGILMLYSNGSAYESINVFMCVCIYIYVRKCIYSIEWTIHRVLSGDIQKRGSWNRTCGHSSMMLKPCVQTNRFIDAVAKLTKIFPFPYAWVDSKLACVPVVYICSVRPLTHPPSLFL